MEGKAWQGRGRDLQFNRIQRKHFVSGIPEGGMQDRGHGNNTQDGYSRVFLGRQGRGRTLLWVSLQEASGTEGRAGRSGMGV